MTDKREERSSGNRKTNLASLSSLFPVLAVSPITAREQAEPRARSFAGTVARQPGVCGGRIAGRTETLHRTLTGRQCINEIGTSTEPKRYVLVGSDRGGRGSPIR